MSQQGADFAVKLQKFLDENSKSVNPVEILGILEATKLDVYRTVVLQYGMRSDAAQRSLPIV